MSNRFQIKTNRSNLMLALCTFAALSAFGCASTGRDAVPPGSHVDILQTAKLTLHGTADASPNSATCDAAPFPAKHLVELPNETDGSIVLRPLSAKTIEVLHVTHLDSNKTWCVMTKGDGAQVSIPGNFASGVYAISVTGSRTTEPERYDVVFQKL